MEDSLPSIRIVADDIRQGVRDPVELVETCLQRIARLEDQVHAWVLVDADGARSAAHALRAEVQQGTAVGRLSGVPLAIKDIVDVKGLATQAGSRLRQHHRAMHDAPVVAALRREGAIILGKTVTTEFACFDPAVTRNPWNLRHTPGGSSSGSAAAVALEMCLAALGSQTGGSIIRPASYCGVAGLKPTMGAVSLQGVVPVSFHLDHLGVLARSADDLAVMWEVLKTCPGHRAGFQYDTARSYDDLPGDGERPRLHLVPALIEAADEAVRSVVWSALQPLREAWRSFAHIRLEEQFDEALVMHRRIMAVEAAQYHRQQYGTNRDAYGKQLSRLISEGLETAAVDYAAALRYQQSFRVTVRNMLPSPGVAIMASTPGTAPAHLDTTGDPRFNSIWSLAGLPAATIPCGVAADGLPCGLQLVAPAGREDLLLHAAAWCERRLNFELRPAINIL